MKPEPRGIGISFIRDMIPEEQTATDEFFDSGSITNLEFITPGNTPVVQKKIITTDVLKKKNSFAPTRNLC